MQDNIDESLFIYNHKEFEEMLDRIFIKLANDILNNNLDSYEMKSHMRLLRKIYYSNLYNMGMAPCYTKDSIMTFDTNGNLYNCHSANIVCGNIRNISEANPELLKIKSECNNCEVKDWCLKCPKVIESKQKYFCYFYKTILTKLRGTLENLLMSGEIK